MEYEFAFREIDYCICLFLVVEGDDVVAVHCIILTEGGFQAGEEGFSVRYTVVWNCTIVHNIIDRISQHRSFGRGHLSVPVTRIREIQKDVVSVARDKVVEYLAVACRQMHGLERVCQFYFLE